MGGERAHQRVGDSVFCAGGRLPSVANYVLGKQGAGYTSRTGGVEVQPMGGRWDNDVL
jgi:hypothetical protein